MSIRLLETIFVAGNHVPADGATISLAAALEADLGQPGQGGLGQPAGKTERQRVAGSQLERRR